MNKYVLLAFMVWAIDTDRLGHPVIESWDKFKKTAVEMKKVYTDFNDCLMYCPRVLDQEPVEFFADWLLSYAKCDLYNKYRDYGKLNERINNYNHELS